MAAGRRTNGLGRVLFPSIIAHPLSVKVARIVLYKMADDKGSKGPFTPKVCFVTTGATAPFEALIECVLSPSSVDALLKAGYTDLLVQYGTAKELFEGHAEAARLLLNEQSQALEINGLDFDRNGLRDQFQLVRRSNGVVISHAGQWLHGREK